MGELELYSWRPGMSKMPGASVYSVNNVKLSFMYIYLFEYVSAVLKQLGQLR